MVYTTLSSVEIGSADIRVSYTGWSRHVHASRVGGRLRSVDYKCMTVICAFYCCNRLQGWIIV